MNARRESLWKTARQRGSSLITTLLVLVVLSTIVVAFMQSMSIERSVARSALNRERAVSAAESSLALAMNRLTSLATLNSVVAVDRSGPNSNAWPLCHIGLSSAGVATNTNSVLPNLPSITNVTIRVSSSYQPVAPLFALTNSAGQTNGAFSFVILDNGAKQNLDRFPAVSPRAYSTTLREVPLVLPDLSTMTAAQSNALNTYASNNVGWTTNMLSVSSVNQLVPSSIPSVGFAQWWCDLSNLSPLVAPSGQSKLDLRRLKFYVDSLAVSQTALPAPNPKSQVVEALLGQTSTVNATSWGGGDLSWLISPGNPGRYTLTEARQIAANLIDYLDEDLHPTTDNINSPSYLGVEGRLLSNGTVRGHPYVVALGHGLVFNISQSSSFPNWLNSTRVLTYWALVNPWSAPISGFHSAYSVELQIEILGNATGGTLGTNAQAYFATTLNERLTEGPSDLAANSGSTYPQAPNQLSFANINSLQPSNRQPPSMGFQNLRFRVARARLIFTDSSGLTSVVQTLDGLGSTPLAMNPPSLTMPTSGQTSVVYNPATVAAGFFLNGDPRLNFRSSTWLQGNLTSGTTTQPPASTPAVSIFATMNATEGDGIQGMSTNNLWYSTSATTNHFFVRSAPVLPGNPATVPFNPNQAPTGLAVDSIAEIGYLSTGRPWQTLRMVEPAGGTPSRRDYRLLDYIDSGTFPIVTNGTRRSVNGKINLNTASTASLTSVFTGVTNLNTSQVASLTSLISGLSSTNYPMLGAGDLGALTNLATPGAVNKFAREDLMRRVANLLTTRSDEFTIFCVGEARDPRSPSRVTSKVTLLATVRLSFSSTGQPTVNVIRKHFL